MRIYGIEIDTEAIAQGIYEMFDENECAAVAFGMFPAKKMQILESQLGDKIERAAKDAINRKYGFRPKKTLKEDFTRESMHHITCDILRYAKSLGRMVA